jgi:Raf kinase inhibitor-like YbhB/YbcL family protein
LVFISLIYLYYHYVPINNIITMPGAPNPYDFLPEAPIFEVTSTDIEEGGTMPPPQLSKVFGVEGGEDCSPSLSWKGFPSDTTKSFVVTCYDPDAPTVSGCWHWVVYDIPASVTSLPSGVVGVGTILPEGAKVLKNDAGFAGFCGAGPPPGHGEHRYIFCVSAMGVEHLPIDKQTSPAVCNFNMFGVGVLARAFLTANYGR